VTYADGSKYEGEFQYDKENGTGIFEDEKSEYHFDGEWLNGMKHGQGVLTHAGYKYIGEFFEGEESGEGSLELPDGGCYSGAWLKGMFHGKGVYIYPSEGECRYEGEFYEQLRHGQGKMYFPDGIVYEGSFH
jgi:hypothetical protein